MLGHSVDIFQRAVLGAGASNPDLIFTVKTDNTGTSNDDQFRLPLSNNAGGILNADTNFTIEWGDGTSDDITAWDDANLTHTYPSAGTYQITIKYADTVNFNGFAFNGSGEEQKLISIDNWGLIKPKTVTAAFRGCSKLVSVSDDGLDLSVLVQNQVAPTLDDIFFGCSNLETIDLSKWDVSSIVNIEDMFVDAVKVTDPGIGGWDTSSVTDMNELAKRATSFAPTGIENWDVSKVTSFFSMFELAPIDADLSGWNTGACTNFAQMFKRAPNIDFDMSNWDISSMTLASQFLRSPAGLSTANYDATLISWNQQAIDNNITGITIDFGNSTYTSGGTAETARTNLVTDTVSGGLGWTITDGGSVAASGSTTYNESVNDTLPGFTDSVNETYTHVESVSDTLPGFTDNVNETYIHVESVNDTLPGFTDSVNETTVAGGAGGGITGLEIDMSHSSWVALEGFALTVGTSITDIIGNGTIASHTEASHSGSANIVSSFADLSDDQYGTDSDYDANDKMLNDSQWDDGDPETTSNTHWSDASSSGLKIFVKFASAQILRDVRLIFNVGAYGFPTVTFKDDAGNTLTPTTAPASSSDTYEGSPSGQASYQWYFN